MVTICMTVVVVVSKTGNRHPSHITRLFDVPEAVITTIRLHNLKIECTIIHAILSLDTDQVASLPPHRQEIAKTCYSSSESGSEEGDDSDPELARRDKICKRTWHSLLMTVAGALGKISRQSVVHKTGILEKMMMCKQAEQGVPLQAEQADWLEDTDEEIDEQELEAHYSYMAKIQEVSPSGINFTNDTPLEQVQNHEENDVFPMGRRHSEQPKSINDTYVLERMISDVIPDSSNIYQQTVLEKYTALSGPNEKFLGTVRFGNDQFAPILGYGDLIQGNVTIKWVYYVEGLNHNLFSVGQFCDADLGGCFQGNLLFCEEIFRETI
ncbi:hypothetical protein Tco_1345626 [Tanacetum coccineum]